MTETEPDVGPVEPGGDEAETAADDAGDGDELAGEEVDDDDLDDDDEDPAVDG